MHPDLLDRQDWRNISDRLEMIDWVKALGRIATRPCYVSRDVPFHRFVLLLDDILPF